MEDNNVKTALQLTAFMPILGRLMEAAKDQSLAILPATRSENGKPVFLLGIYHSEVKPTTEQPVGENMHFHPIAEITTNPEALFMPPSPGTYGLATISDGVIAMFKGLAGDATSQVDRQAMADKLAEAIIKALNLDPDGKRPEPVDAETQRQRTEAVLNMVLGARKKRLTGTVEPPKKRRNGSKG